MIYRTLGRTGIQVSVIGFGTEHLPGPQAEVAAIAHEAVDHGINYFDFLLGISPGYHENYGRALRGLRDRVAIAGHLDVGTPDRPGSVEHAATAFDQLLARLQTDYVDVCLLQFVDEESLYERITEPGGLLDLARRLKQQGKARAIGMSSHMAPVALRAVQDGWMEALMFPINPAFDALPGYLPALTDLWDRSALPAPPPALAEFARRSLYHACAAAGVGLVAMKPFAAGFLFAPEVYGGAPPLTAVQCLSYALAQPGVSTVVPGLTTHAQLHEALGYLVASAEELDYGPSVAGTRWSIIGHCMYCNHCLPCPAGIDVARTIRLIDSARRGVTPDLRRAYGALAVGPSGCLECGDCTRSCPFRVDVIGVMREGLELFA